MANGFSIVYGFHYVLRGHFDPDTSEDQASPVRARGVGASEDLVSSQPHGLPHKIDTQWCARRLLARIHRLTLDSLRRQMEPVTPEELIRFLLDWNHLSTSRQVYGREGVLDVIEKNQGFEIPAVLWEQAILPSRVAEYNPKWLDEICLSGEVVWGRVSTGASRDATKILPITMMLREDLDWLRSNEVGPDDLGSDAKLVFSTLQTRGALFLNEIVSVAQLLPTQVQDALWELVAAGRVSGDGFGAIRSLTSPLREKAQRLRRHIRRRGIKTFGSTAQSGRWWVIQRPANSENGQTEQADSVGAIHESPVIVSAADPMNLIGILTPGAKIPATASNAVAYLGGRYVGHRVAGEVWVDPKLEAEAARKIERALKSGRRITEVY